MKTEDAVAFFGSVKRLSEVLNINRKAIYAWGEKVPHARQYEIEVKTDCQLESEYTQARKNKVQTPEGEQG